MIYLDENGITIKASKEAVVGEEYELNGEKYKVVDEDMLGEMVKNEEDVTKVVTSRVWGMESMFKNASSFNQDIGAWDVSNVLNMTSMFKNAESFNQNIGSWDVIKVAYKYSIFTKAISFKPKFNPFTRYGYGSLSSEDKKKNI